MKLYPLKFTPILKDRIWGGTRLETLLGKELKGAKKIGESWEISGVEGDISVVANGPLAGNDLQELIEVYMSELVGEKVYDKFGLEFPILIKIIDANDDLSIQVHPDDEFAAEKHNSFGKTEMWYAMDGGDDVSLINGFNKDVSKAEFVEKLNNNTLPEIFNYEKVNTGDSFFIPAKRMHAICKNNLIAEIQQTSDITYRIYDYNRKDENGNGRELHTELSFEVMDFSKVTEPKVNYTPQLNKPVQLATCEYFTTNLIELTQAAERDYYEYDSFAILIGVEGSCKIAYGENKNETISLIKGETVLIPASVHDIALIPDEGGVKLLEVYIK